MILYFLRLIKHINYKITILNLFLIKGKDNIHNIDFIKKN